MFNFVSLNRKMDEFAFINVQISFNLSIADISRSLNRLLHRVVCNIYLNICIIYASRMAFFLCVTLEYFSRLIVGFFESSVVYRVQ